MIRAVSESGVEISNIQTGHFTTLGKDHIHHFTSNAARSRGSERFGFLTLHVQIYVQASNLWLRPTIRPGERLPPPKAEAAEKWVDLRYPASSGLQTHLERMGYMTRWCSDHHLARRTDLEGWKIVVEPDAMLGLVKFRVRDRPFHHTLVKKVK